MFDYNPVPKNTKSQRIKPTQKQLGEITPNVRQEVKERSQGVCEVQKKCTGAIAREMAHLINRGRMEWKTTAEDLLHSCVECHRWLDGTPEGIKYRRSLVKLPFSDIDE
jgi:hypothetical protein